MVNDILDLQSLSTYWHRWHTSSEHFEVQCLARGFDKIDQTTKPLGRGQPALPQPPPVGTDESMGLTFLE